MKHPSKRSPHPRPGSTLPAAAMPAMQAAVGAHRAGRLPEAIQFYRQALKAAPRAPEIHYNLGVALKNTGQARAAEKALTEAVRLRPAYALAHSMLADLCHQSGRGAKALRHRLDAYRADPNAGAIVSGLVTQLGLDSVQRGRPTAFGHRHRSAAAR